MIRFMIVALMVLVSPSLVRAEDGQALKDLVTEALETNPGVDALARQVEALETAVVSAGIWPDLMMGLDISNQPVLAPLAVQHPMSGIQLQVQQTFKPPGWSKAQRAVAQARTVPSTYAVDAMRLDLAKQVEVAWYQLIQTRMLQAVTVIHLERTVEILDAVRIRYEVGQAGQHMTLRLELLRDRLEDELGEFVRMDRELSASLNRALSRNGEAHITTPQMLDANHERADLETWLEQAMANNPTLAKLDAMAETEYLSANLARIDSIPDITVRGGYRIRWVETATDPGMNLISLGVTAPLPIGSIRKGKQQVQIHELNADTYVAQHHAMVDLLVAQLTGIHARLERAQTKAATYQDVLIPSAQAALETTLNDFMVGKADFSSLYEAEVDLLNLERMRIGAAVQTHVEWSAAFAIMGTTQRGVTK